ncbi:MAG TPA: MipA/OmpV family protein [Aquabacterium sp.]|nr:MipA/OmpV family protein [Aquabacterium sp.]
MKAPLSAVAAMLVLGCLGAAVQARAADGDPGEKRASSPDAVGGPPPGWVGPPPGWSGGVLAGAARLPRYEGGSGSRTQPVLGMQASYRSLRWGTVEMGSRGIGWTVVQQPALSLGAGLQVDPGRVDNGDDKLTPLGYRPGGERLRGLGEIKAAPVLVLSGSAAAGRVSVSTALRRTLGSHEGTQVGLGLAWPLQLRPHARLVFAPSATWADQRTMAAYFGVSAQQSLASGFDRYRTGPGWKSAQLELQFEADFSRDWHLQATLQRRRLLNDAARSPVIERRDSTAGMLALLYTFRW